MQKTKIGDAEADIPLSRLPMSTEGATGCLSELPGKRRLIIRLVLLVVAGLMSTSMFAAPMASYYVSPSGNDGNSGDERNPFLTISKARDVVRTKTGAMSGDIVVYLRGGTYALSDTLRFTENDSGTGGHNVIYKAYTNETPIVSGGQAITGWSAHDGSGNVYKASISLQFRQLYVNGSRAIRARTPNCTNDSTLGDYYIGATVSTSKPYTVNVDAALLGNWTNMNQVELVWTDHFQHKRARMAGYSGGTISLQSPESDSHVIPNFNQHNIPYFFENAYEFLDAEGEWYLDTGNRTLYYKPRRGEDMSSVEVIAPRVETLLSIMGSSPLALAKHIQFQGITFQYSTWTKPDSRGYLNLQAALCLDTDGNSPVPGAIQMQNVDNITIEGCTVRRTGAHAILAPGDDVKNCAFVNNLITDTAAGGIYLLLTSASSSSNVINGNTLERGGMVYTDACGILVKSAPYTTLQHNEVRNYRYTGITVGWAWTEVDTAARNYDVGHNRIHDVMQLHDDGGGIYSLGKIPGMNIHDNYIYNLYASPYQDGYAIAGVYLDNGSCHKTVQANVMDAIQWKAVFAMNAPNHDNLIKDNYYNCTQGEIARENTLQNNTPVSGTNWPQAALNIMRNSGTRPGSPAATAEPKTTK